MTRHIYVETEEGRTEHATSRKEASMHWELLAASGYTPVEFTGDI